jgi:hypothetical protein
MLMGDDAVYEGKEQGLTGDSLEERFWEKAANAALQATQIHDRIQTDPKSLRNLFAHYERNLALGKNGSLYATILYLDRPHQENRFEEKDWRFIQDTFKDCYRKPPLYILGGDYDNTFPAFDLPPHVNLPNVDIVLKWIPAQIRDILVPQFEQMQEKDPSFRGVKMLGFSYVDMGSFQRAQALAQKLSEQVGVVELYDRRFLDHLYHRGNEAARPGPYNKS